MKIKDIVEARMSAAVKLQRAQEKDKQGVAEGLEEITEYRDRMYQYIKSIVPGFPDYVVKDWLYANFARGATQGPNWSFDTIGKDIPNILKDMGLSVDTKWQLVPNMKFTMDMWEPKTLKRLQARAGGSSKSTEPDVHIPARDAERHATQAQLAQQQGGVRKEPVILIKTSNGYELLEGWHRTIQHFAQYPNGYTGPAYVAVAQGQQGVAEAGDNMSSFEEDSAMDDNAIWSRYGQYTVQDLMQEFPQITPKDAQTIVNYSRYAWDFVKSGATKQPEFINAKNQVIQRVQQAMSGQQGVTEGDSGAKYKIKSIGKDKNGDYYISPSTGKKVYKSGVKRGDHENPKTGEHKGVAEGNSGAKYKMVCKDCGDVFNKPTTNCRHDSHDSNGPNWIKKNEGVEENLKSKMVAAMIAANLLGSPAQAAEEPIKPITIAYVTIEGEVKKYNLGDKFTSSMEAEKFISGVLDKQGLQGYHLEIKHGYPKKKEEVKEAPLEMDPADPMDPMIYGHDKANPAKLKYRMLRAAGQLKDLAARATNASPGEWQLMARQFEELKMNMEQIRHALEELGKVKSKGGIRSRGITV